MSKSQSGIQRRQNTKQALLNIRKLDSRNTYGDKLRKKKTNSNMRLVFQNIHGFGTADETCKDELIKEFINEYKIDSFNMSEVNTNWKIVAKKKSLTEMAKEWFEHSNVSTAHNTITSTKKPYQPGGVATISSGTTALNIIKKEQDKRYMGRWCSTLYQGKNKLRLRVVSIYVPSESTSTGSKTIYEQQKAILLKTKVAKGTLETFWKDLWKDIDKWIENKEQIIIGGDWNIQVQEEELLEGFRQRNIRPVVQTKHPGQLPPTYNRGKKALDEIFVTEDVEIVKCGYLQHGILTSDHCPIWVEVTKKSVLGSKSEPVQKYKARRLKSNNPNVIKKYNFELEKQLEERNLYSRTAKLYKTFQSPLTLSQQKEYNNIDKQREEAMCKAEKKCRKLHMGAVPWSPAIQEVRTKIFYLKLCRKQRTKVKVSRKLLMRQAKKSKLYCEHIPIKEIDALLHEHYKRWKKLKKKAVKLRINYLEHLAELYEKDGKGTKAKILKAIIHTEDQKAMFKRLKHISGKLGENLSTTSVIITRPNGTKKQIYKRKQMKKVIREENIKKYHQSEDTCQFLKPQLKREFGEYGEGPETEKLQAGQYNYMGNPKSVNEFLHICIPNSPITTMKRTPTEFRRSWKKMKEKTSSHGNLHFGHFKAACNHNKNILLHYALAEIPFRTGFSPLRWQQATNVMILKKAGLYNLEKLRTLCLFQADFNHNNKFLGKSTMAHATEHQLTAAEQYSTPGKK